MAAPASDCSASGSWWPHDSQPTTRSSPEPNSVIADTLAEPHQHEKGLVEAGERPGSASRAAGASFGGQQAGEVAHEFPGHVEHGTIGNHVEPSL
jgi:hypothetical protein